MPLFAPVMMTRLPASEGMSAAFHFSLISVLDVAAWRLRCELFPLCRCVQAASSSGLTEKCVDYVHVFVRFLVGGQMAAPFKDDELCSGNCFVDVPSCNRRDIHVVSSGDDHSGEFELWQLWREVEGFGCFLDGGGDLRDGFEILDAGQVGIAIRFAVEEHEEVIADTLVGRSGAIAVALFAGGDLFQHVGEDVWKNAHD